MVNKLRSISTLALAGLCLSAALTTGCGDKPNAPAPVAQTPGPAKAGEKPAQPAPTAPNPAPVTPKADPVAPVVGEVQPPAKAAAEYLLLAEVRINSLEKTLGDLRAFMDHSVPMFSAAAMGEIYPVLVHGSKLDGVDGSKSLRLLLFTPKKVFALPTEKPAPAAGAAGAEGLEDADGDEADEQEGMQETPQFAELIPIKDEKAYLEMLADEIDEIIKDGDYRGFTPNEKMGEVIFKFSGKYAVFSKSKEGIELGIKEIPAIEAREAKLKDGSSAAIEIRPQDLFKATGLSDPKQRKEMLDKVEAVLAKQLDEMGQELGPVKVMVNVKPAQVRMLIEDALGVADQAETVGLTTTVNKDACELGMALTATPGTALAKRFSGMKAADLKNLRGLDGITPFMGWTGSMDPMVREMVERVVGILPGEQAKQMEKLLTALKSIEGQPMASFGGVDDKGLMRLATEVNFKEGSDLTKMVDDIGGVYKTLLAQGKEMNQLYAELEMGAAEDKEGWSVRKVTVTYKADPADPVGPMQLNVVKMMIGNPIELVVMTKGTRLIYANGVDADDAFANAKAFAAGSGKLKLSEAYTGFLKTAVEDRHAVLLEYLDACPLVKRGLAIAAPDPALAKLADQTIGTANPLTFAVYAKDGKLEGSMRVEADTVKQWVAFGMQAAMQIKQGGGGGVKPEEVPAPPAPGQGQDF